MLRLACALLPALIGSAAAQSPAEVRHGDGQQEFFGSTVVAFSDVDRDGREDFAVAVPGDTQRGPLSGSVKVFTAEPCYERLNLLGWERGDLFGSALARVPDLDCDGVDELLVGAPGASPNGRGCGRVAVFSGADARILLEIWGERAGDEFGAAVCALGDLTGDGISEIAVGAPGARWNGRDSGLVRVYDGTRAQIVYTFHGERRGERFGTSLAGPGDMDGDGVPDLAVGAPAPRMDRPGSTRVLSGLDASVLYTFGGQSTWDLFGTSLAGVGDVDGDGKADLLVGAPAARPGEATLESARGHGCGAATLFSGASGTPLFQFTSEESEDRFGSAVAAGPDLDGDGARELLIGAPQRLRPRAGAVHAFSPRTGELVRSWSGMGTGEQFGASFATLASEDGRSQLLVGSPNDSSRGASAGTIARIELAPSAVR